jgi:hypothetical protein
MDLGQVLRVFLFLFGIPMLVLPTLGGGLVFVGFQIARIPNMDYWKCWKVYLAGCCYGFLVLVAVGFGLQRSDLGPGVRQAIQAGVFCGMQLLLIPLLLRHYSRRAITAASIAIVFTNLLTLGLILFLRD